MSQPRGRIGRRGLFVSALLLAVLVYGVVVSRPEIVFEDTGDFGRVRVVERRDGLRTLYIGAGRARQSAGWPDRPGHLEIAYTRVGMIGPALAPASGRILFVGLGGGSMPRFTRHVLPDARIDAVEIDPLIVDVAQRYFGVVADSMLQLHTGDGRAFIEAAPPARWDVIVLDAYSDDAIPRALATLEFLRAVDAALAPDGVVAANLWSANPLYPAMLATYDSVFAQVRLVRVPGRPQYIVLAGAATRPLDRAALVAAARNLAARATLGFDLPALVGDGFEVMPRVNDDVLRDRPD